MREREVQARIQITDAEIDALLAKQRGAAGGSAPSSTSRRSWSRCPRAPREPWSPSAGARRGGAGARAQAGEDFDAVAREVSEDANRRNGGEIGLRPADRLPDVFVEAVRDAEGRRGGARRCCAAAPASTC